MRESSEGHSHNLRASLPLEHREAPVREALYAGIESRDRYKKAIERVLRYCVGLEYGASNPSSIQEVMSEVKALLDWAFLVIDEVCAEGVFDVKAAQARKDRLLRAVHCSCVAKGLLEEPQDPLSPDIQALGYEMPRATRVSKVVNKVWCSLRSLLQTQVAGMESKAFSQRSQEPRR